MVKDSTGAPGWMYAVDLSLWTFTANLAGTAWRRSAGRRARVADEGQPFVLGEVSKVQGQLID